LLTLAVEGYRNRLRYCSSPVFVSLCATKEGLTVLKIDKNRGGAIPEPIPISFNRKCQQITELSNGTPPF